VALPVATLVTVPKPPKPRSDALPKPQHYTLGPNGTKRYFVVHGGLFSDDSVGLEDVRKIDRVKQQQPVSGTIFGEALWTDPQDMPGRGPSKRGVGLGFGPDITKRWTEANQVTALIRSHEVRQEGYSMEHNGLCITVFSAPNYVGCFVGVGFV
jgi:serine/threonine-protein phosphatase 5